MDKYPVTDGEKTTGELSVWSERLYTVFDIACSGQSGLWCAWAVGRDGTLRIGVPEPEGDRLCIRRRFSQRLTEPLGPILRGELRPLGAEREHWEPQEQAAPFHSRYLNRQFRGRKGIWTCSPDDCRLVAIPRDDREPFLLEAMFCFAQLRQVRGQDCWVFAFDAQEWPKMP